jgi:hypothetical protein
VTSAIYDARNFRLVLMKELQRLHSPRYPQRDFWRALERAEHADVVRAVTAVNAAEDVCYFDRQQSRSQSTEMDEIDSRYLNSGYSPAKAKARAAHLHTCKKTARAKRAEAVSCP